MEKLRVLLLGAAFAANIHMDAYTRITNKVEIAGVCAHEEMLARALAARYGLTGVSIYTDYVSAIEQCDCDLIDVCLPNFLHYDAVIKAINAGRDVICEKPLATTYKDAARMVDAAERAGRRIYYAEDWFFAPALQKARDILESGQLGRMLYARARECHSGSHSQFAQTLKYCGGGCLIHLGVHPVGFLLALKQFSWTELIAMTSGGNEKNIAHKQMEGEDWAGAFIRFADGTFATVEANYVTTGGMEDVLDIYCEHGCIHVDLTFTSPVNVFSIKGLDYTVEKAEITTGWSRPAVDEKYNLGYCDEINYFVDCARARAEPRAGLRGKDGLETLHVIEQIYASAREGRRIVNE